MKQNNSGRVARMMHLRDKVSATVVRNKREMSYLMIKEMEIAGSP